MPLRPQSENKRPDLLWILALGSLLAVIALTAVVTFATTKPREYIQTTETAAVLPDAEGMSCHAPGGPAQMSHADFFTNNGLYMPRTHCLMNEAGNPDWPWIIALIVLQLGVVLAYLRIYIFWCKAYFSEQRKDRNNRLMDLAQIFLWCAVCGYGASVVMFVWPAYRMLAIVLFMLNIWSWRFAFNLSGFRSTFSAGRYQRLAESDRLTGLPNRFAVTQLIDDHLQPASETAPEDMHVLFLDFDRFKMINDSMGHEAGDELLRTIAGRLNGMVETMKSKLPPDATCVPGRLGGDEFVVILTGVSSADVELVSDEIHRACNQPYILNGRTIHCTVSIGVASTETEYSTADEMLRDADTAMYVAKREGRGTTVRFDRSMHEAVRNAIEIENDLRHALEFDELIVHYQPIIDLETGAVSAFEALVRWNHPRRGLLLPGEFIEVAEESGMIVDIGRWVLQEATHQLGVWRESFSELCDVVMNVNVSRKQLIGSSLLEEALGATLAAALPPDALCLEITEGTIMHDRERSVQLLQQLRDAGFRLAMDDFGTGYSSLSCLHEFPLTTLKIDRSFVANLAGNRDYAAVVHAIATLAGNLGFDVTAEGIETPEQLAQLQALGCHHGQGHYFQRAVSVEAIEQYITIQDRAQSA